ncbi:MAG TPA: thioesterase family protein [Spirochaetota bacterium]|nr:thioesterase family protein [Spirochaetota bacterium]
MPRIKLIELENYRFSYEKLINIANINIAGHTGSVEMTDLIQEARYRIMKTLGLSDLNLGDGSTGGIMADIVINFKGEIFLDDIVSVEMDFAEFDGKGYRVFYRILKNNKVVAVAETGFVTFSFSEKKTVNVPPIFIDKLKAVTQKQRC